MTDNIPLVIPTYRISFSLRGDDEDCEFATIETDFVPMGFNVGDTIDSAYISAPLHGSRPRFYEIVEIRHFFIDHEGEFQHSITLFVTTKN